MSIETWKKIAYPIPANHVDAVRTELSAAQHSLRKWEHLTKDILAAHGLKKLKREGSIIDDSGNSSDDFDVDYSTCALCRRHDDGGDCESCILGKLRGGDGCSDPTLDEVNHPYGMFIQFGDPQPMIELLRIAVNDLEKIESAGVDPAKVKA